VPPAHECPTHLHQEDTVVLVEGLVAVRLSGLAWLLGFATAGLFVALLPPATARALTPFVAGGAGWEPPMVARMAAFAVAAALGVFLSLWRPQGHDPLTYGLIRLRHRLTPAQAVWRPAAAYDPPARWATGPEPAGDEESEEYGWPD
jgi:hypothetical protein